MRNNEYSIFPDQYKIFYRFVEKINGFNPLKYPIGKTQFILHLIKYVREIPHTINKICYEKRSHLVY
jgi:hypothetical protein